MTGNIHDVSLLLGQLKAQIDNLTKEVHHAAETRKANYETLEKIRLELHRIKPQLENLEKRIVAVEKPMSEIQRWRERGIGAMMLVSMMAALIGGTVATYWQKILAVFKGF